MKGIVSAVTGWLAKAGRAVVRGLRTVIPVVQDPPREWVRKLAFWMALLVFVGAGYYLLDDLWIQPQQAKSTLNTLRDLYHAGSTGEDTIDGTDTTVYPEGMSAAFRTLYRYNNDVRAWLTFRSGNDDAIFDGAIDNPVVQAADNDYYLYTDFWGNYNKSGTLFFDYRNDLSADSADRNWIIYGHNLNSQLMFSRFNWLASGNLDRARLLTTLTLDTLYEQDTYKVLAVMVLNTEESEGPVFNYLRTEFSGDEDFLDYVEEIRRRSVYDFGDVDVQAGDRLLTLSTCSNRRDSHLKEGRIVVVARKVRAGESTQVDVSRTVLNEDVLMPMAWYLNQDLEVPEEYLTGTTTATVNTTTVAGGATTVTPAGETTTTALSPGQADGGTTTTLPSAGGSSTTSTTAYPMPGSTTVPGVTAPSASVTVPGEGDSTTAPAGETTATVGEETTVPSAEETTLPAAEDTTATDGESTTTAETTVTEPESTTTTVEASE